VAAAENCDIIVHLAYGTSGDEDTKKEITVLGTENILKAALKKGVRKVICFSTAAVYGLNPKSPVVDESTPFEPSHEVYRASKIEAEGIMWRYHKEHGLPVVVFRPPLIYGPHGVYWTARIVKEIQKGAILVNGGGGAANLVYVDNLIDAILLAMETDAGDGEAFNVVDDDRLTWHDVYHAYAGMVDSHPPLRNMSVEEIEDMRKGDEPNDLKSWLITPLLLVPEMVRTSLQSPEIRHKIMQVPMVATLEKTLVQGNTGYDEAGWQQPGNHGCCDGTIKPYPIAQQRPGRTLCHPVALFKRENKENFGLQTTHNLCRSP
jgi:dTDP-4-dehydrorhamnose reductase